MTSNRTPDRLIRAWLEFMPDEAPDRVIADALQAIESTPQVRRPLVPALRRFQPMNRFTYAAAAAVVLAVVAGGALLLKPAANVGGTPTAAPAAAPAAMRSTWLASSGTGSAILRLAFSSSGDRVSVGDAGVEMFMSRPVAGASDELDLIATDPAGGCKIGDLGRYRYALGNDGTLPDSGGTLLGLTVVADSCEARATTLGRSWVHALDESSMGGRGIVTAFSPMFLITLPAAPYTASKARDVITATSTRPDETLYVVRNPIGFTDPCSERGGAKRPVDPTIAAFTAYLSTLPGFTVQSSPLSIDGHPAVRLTIPSSSTADCQSHKVNEWTTSNPADTGGWNLNQGETDVLYLVEVDGNLILLQWLGAAVTTADQQAVIASVRFTDTLPR